jgi:hypothetical protein
MRHETRTPKMMHMIMQTVVVIEHLKKPEENHNFKNITTMSINNSRLNTNPMRYIVKGYCLKYPNDPRDQNIKDEDVVHPANHKWKDK